MQYLAINQRVLFHPDIPVKAFQLNGWCDKPMYLLITLVSINCSDHSMKMHNIPLAGLVNRFFLLLMRSVTEAAQEWLLFSSFFFTLLTGDSTLNWLINSLFTVKPWTWLPAKCSPFSIFSFDAEFTPTSTEAFTWKAVRFIVRHNCLFSAGFGFRHNLR